MAFNTAQAIYQGMIQRGVPPQVATGAVASLMGEGGQRLNPNAFRANDAGPGLHSYGFGQWNRDRKSALDQTAAQLGTSWNDPRAQVQHLFNELDDPAQKRTVLAQLRNATSAPQGTAIWTGGYEVPQDIQGEIAKRTANLPAAVNAITGGAQAPAQAPAPTMSLPPQVNVNPYGFGGGILTRPSPPAIDAVPTAPAGPPAGPPGPNDDGSPSLTPYSFGNQVPGGLLDTPAALPQTLPQSTVETPQVDTTPVSSTGAPGVDPAANAAALASAAEKKKYEAVFQGLAQIADGLTKKPPAPAPVTPVAAWNHPGVPLYSLPGTQIIRPGGTPRGILG